jgi:hypothetical protein
MGLADKGWRDMVDRGVDARGGPPPEEGRQLRKPWSTPRVILSEVRSTLHLVGATPLDKITFSPDNITPNGSQGS